MNNFIDNDEYENDENQSNETPEGGNVVSIESKKAIRPAFAYWEVGDKKLQLKLITSEIVELEKKFRKNLINLLGDEDNIPPLTTMFQIIHSAALPYNHGIKLKDIMNFYDKYQMNGGTQLNLYVDVYIQIFMVSGFFSSSMVEDVTDSMERVRENM
ncbi:MAG: DUF6096 family protein [Lachnospiraceae bacterium]|nr:DUF6096 family protein [Lachnospiraceae bacterium]